MNTYDLMVVFKAYMLKHYPHMIKDDHIEEVTKIATVAGLLDISGNTSGLHYQITQHVWSDPKFQIDGITESECHQLAQIEAMVLKTYLKIKTWSDDPLRNKIRPADYQYDLCESDFNLIYKYFTKHGIWGSLWNPATNETTLINGNWFHYEDFIHQIIDMRKLIMKRVGIK